jgi:hypothetical protein
MPFCTWFCYKNDFIFLSLSDFILFIIIMHDNNWKGSPRQV